MEHKTERQGKPEPNVAASAEAAETVGAKAEKTEKAEKTTETLRRRRLNRVIVAVFSVVFLAGVIVPLAVHSGKGGEVYGVYLRGQRVGYVEDSELCRQASDAVEKRYSELLGAGFSDDIGFSCEAVAVQEEAPEFLTQETMEAMLCDELSDYVTQASVLQINGQIVGACEDRGTAEAVLDRILSEKQAAFAATFGEEVTAEFRSNVQITDGAVYVSDLLDAEGLYEAAQTAARESLSGDLLACTYSHTKTVEEVIPYPSEAIYDDTRYPYYRRVIVEGADGLARNTCRRVYDETGSCVSSEVLSSELLAETVGEVAVEGCRSYQPGVTTGTFIRPLDIDALRQNITSTFGENRDLSFSTGAHTGTDIQADMGTPIYASDGGVVTMCALHHSHGNVIYIQHDNGYRTIYAHMSAFADGIEVGTEVSQGQLIGYVGSTGTSTGPHLHFEVYRQFSRVDGASLLDLTYGGY